jgi:hypothetical protein
MVEPVGRQQITPTEELVFRLKTCEIAGIAPFQAEWLPTLTAALELLLRQADELGQAVAAHSDAFKRELALRDEHAEAVDKVIELVRAAGCPIAMDVVNTPLLEALPNDLGEHRNLCLRQPEITN